MIALDALDALVRLCPPPADFPPGVDWAQAERALGAALPADYKQLVETYGDGIFDDTIWLLVPDSAFSECDLHAQTTERDEILADLWEFEAKPRRPAGGGGPGPSVGIRGGHGGLPVLAGEARPAAR